MSEPYLHCQCGHHASSHAIACGHQGCPCLRYSRCECRPMPHWFIKLDNPLTMEAKTWMPWKADDE